MAWVLSPICSALMIWYLAVSVMVPAVVTRLKVLDDESFQILEKAGQVIGNLVILFWGQHR